MLALVTGGTSGIGLEMAKELDKRGYDLVLVSERSEVDKSLFKNKVEVINLDLSKKDNCYKLHDMIKNVDVFINNAGFGLFGAFDKTDIDKEIKMIDVNVTAVHILTKLYLKDMEEKNSGYILNTASAAAFAYGPLMSTYYSTKSYVYKLTLSIYEELRRNNSNVVISCLCPGPVYTKFQEKADVTFTTNTLSSEYVGKYAINKLFKKKLVIAPSLGVKLARVFINLLPLKLALKICYGFQKRKDK
ncbi:MAG: SDR family NAD(P)-dependent oxidoreductase [Bacilli bacterium]|nr:SDR family NAD(P)-dependent oxidoreductase [Bacilli bacterium]